MCGMVQGPQQASNQLKAKLVTSSMKEGVSNLLSSGYSISKKGTSAPITFQDPGSAAKKNNQKPNKPNPILSIDDTYNIYKIRSLSCILLILLFVVNKQITVSLLTTVSNWILKRQRVKSMIMGGMPYLESSFDIDHHHKQLNNQAFQYLSHLLKSINYKMVHNYICKNNLNNYHLT